MPVFLYFDNRAVDGTSSSSVYQSFLLEIVYRLAAKKEQQNQKLQERLEEMKRKKEEERAKSRGADSRVDHQFDNEAYEQDLIIEKYWQEK